MDAPGSGSRALSRRDLLRATALGGVALFLAACGSSQPPATSAPSSLPTSSPEPSVAEPSSRAVVAPSARPSAAPSVPAGPTLREKIAGLMVVGFRGSRLEQTPVAPDRARARPASAASSSSTATSSTGASRNVLSPAQVQRLTSATCGGRRDRGIIVGVDQEGGIVTRLGPATAFRRSHRRRRSAGLGGATPGPGRGHRDDPRGRRLQPELRAGRRPRRQPDEPGDRRARSVLLGGSGCRRRDGDDRDRGPPGGRRPDDAQALPGDRQLDDEHRLRRRRRDEDLDADGARAVPPADRRAATRTS